MLSHRALYLHALDLTAAYHLDDRVVEMLAVPLFHANGWGRPHSAALNGITQVVLPRFDATRALALVQEERVTWIGLVPAMAQALLDVPGRDQFDLSSLRCLHVGGSSCPPELTERLERVFHCQVVRAYGLTETGPGAISTRPRRGTYGVDRTGGWPLPGCEVRIVDRQLRDVARDGRDVGEIVIRGDHLMSGYYGHAEAATSAFTPDGWLLTGDLGVWDEDGNVRVVDRKKDVIISGGENISSVEIENALLAHADVVECAVVAASDEMWGEVPAAFVVLKAGAVETAETLRAHVRERLAGFKVPKVLEIVAGPLPRTGTGKIAKQILRDRFRV
jgi:fatty-acyl-CoA synthase